MSLKREETGNDARGEQMIRIAGVRTDGTSRITVARLISTLVLALACVALALPVSALAGTIEWPGGNDTGVVVDPTRAHFYSQLVKYLTEVQVRVEYGPTGSGPWTLVSEGTCNYGLGPSGSGSGNEAHDYCSPPFEGNPGGEVRHLKPSTHYYVRFLAESTEGNAEQIVPFCHFAGKQARISGRGLRSRLHL
jgi:hypothetical protein